jgi:hypothetical protein
MVKCPNCSWKGDNQEGAVWIDGDSEETLGVPRKTGYFTLECPKCHKNLTQAWLKQINRKTKYRS